MVISGGKHKNSEKNLLQFHFVLRVSRLSHPGFKPGLLDEKLASNRLSCDTAALQELTAQKPQQMTET
jgi:hypothetical protein